MSHLTKDEEREIAARAREKGSYVLAWAEDARSDGERAYYGARHFESRSDLLEELDHDEGDVRAYRAHMTPGGSSVLQPLAARLLREAADKWDPSALLRQVRELEDWTQSDLAGRLGLKGSPGQVAVSR